MRRAGAALRGSFRSAFRTGRVFHPFSTCSYGSDAPISPSEFAAALSPLLPSTDTASLTLVAAVSGGADSLSLALLLHEWSLSLSERDRPALAAVCVDHKLRPAAAAEAAAVCSFLSPLGFATHTLPVDWNASGEKGGVPEKGQVQVEAREKRRSLLVSHTFAISGETTGVLLLGHHAEDAAETVVMRVFRGSGIHGLMGPPPLAKTFLDLETRTVSSTNTDSTAVCPLAGSLHSPAAVAMRAASARAAAPPSVLLARPLLQWGKARLRATVQDRLIPGNSSVTVGSDGRVLVRVPASQMPAKVVSALTGASPADEENNDDAWIEDPYNADEGYDRVRARVSLFPSTLPHARAPQQPGETAELLTPQTVVAGVAALSRRASTFSAAVDVLLRERTVVLSPHGHVVVDVAGLAASATAATGETVETVGSGETVARLSAGARALACAALARVLTVVAATPYTPSAASIESLWDHIHSQTGPSARVVHGCHVSALPPAENRAGLGETASGLVLVRPQSAKEAQPPESAISLDVPEYPSALHTLVGGRWWSSLSLIPKRAPAKDETPKTARVSVRVAGPVEAATLAGNLRRRAQQSDPLPPASPTRTKAGKRLKWADTEAASANKGGGCSRAGDILVPVLDILDQAATIPLLWRGTPPRTRPAKGMPASTVEASTAPRIAVGTRFFPLAAQAWMWWK